MPIFLCYDPAPRTTCWTQEKRRSMIAEFAKRRIKYFSVSSPDELRGYLEQYPNELSSLVFFPASETQRKYLFERYREFDIHRIIFSHHDVGVAESNFSYIMSDFYGDMKLAISHLRERGCKRVALFCANLGSYHDRMRVETYKHFLDGEVPLVFTTTDKVYPCLHELMKCEEKIDAILCINDFVAFCLMLFLEHLDKDWRKKIAVLSFSNTILSSLCSPSLSSLSLNYTDGGREVATIHKAVAKNPKMAYMHIVMKSALSARETTLAEHPEGIVFADLPSLDDDELHRIIGPQKKCMALEKLLSACDETDLAIIHGLITGATLSEIASRMYLTRDSIKYRVRKFKDMLKYSHTSEVAEMFKKWISPEKLEKMIIEMKRA